MKRYKDLISGLFIVVVSIAMYISSNNIKKMVVTSIGPDFFPKLVAVILGVLGIILTIQAIVRDINTSRTTSDTDEGLEKKKLNFRDIFKRNLDIVTLLLLILYSVLIDKLGFLISTMIYIFVQIMLMFTNRKKNYIAIVSISIVFTFIVYFFFRKVLNVMLPAGLLG